MVRKSQTSRGKYDPDEGSTALTRSGGQEGAALTKIKVAATDEEQGTMFDKLKKATDLIVSRP